MTLPQEARSTNVSVRATTTWQASDHVEPRRGLRLSPIHRKLEVKQGEPGWTSRKPPFIS